jgi:deoxyribonuclease V
LVYHGRVVGTALRSKDRVKPLYVSVGHRVTLDEATDLVLRCCLKHRLPEPSRLAHLAAQAWARGEGERG